MKCYQVGLYGLFSYNHLTISLPCTCWAIGYISSSLLSAVLDLLRGFDSCFLHRLCCREDVRVDLRFRLYCSTVVCEYKTFSNWALSKGFNRTIVLPPKLASPLTPRNQSQPTATNWLQPACSSSAGSQPVQFWGHFPLGGGVSQFLRCRPSISRDPSQETALLQRFRRVSGFFRDGRGLWSRWEGI